MIFSLGVRFVLKNFTDDQIQFILGEIQNYYLNERNEKISTNEANKVLEFFNYSIAPFFYNAILNDVIELVERQYSQLSGEIVNLQKMSMKETIKN
ncbi:DUF2164 family protein [Lysinibacillus antri]|uniref:DUF2164 family protein n=1 Tax=Lysinibacillus antri TaxID=2498145 RepID=A0A432L867_9BACI|nr:DUF2164 family protein [Lysinibacillus antri]TSI08676.1 DUF2164 family protein [Lysinibacillus sp. BW-2-10]